jgi:hypothetical protein
MQEEDIHSVLGPTPDLDFNFSRAKMRPATSIYRGPQDSMYKYEPIFVSAFIDIGSAVKSPEYRIGQFKHLADSGMRIHLFLSKSFEAHYDSIIGPRPNITVERIELEDLETYKELSDMAYTVPPSNNPQKDTVAYHIVQNAKIEFVQRASRLHISSHFAWIDFNICQMFRTIPETIAYLRNNMEARPGLYMPGCWPKGYGQDSLFQTISWRFCGSFFIGDVESIRALYMVYRNLFKRIVTMSTILTWEVNIWHYMEIHGHFQPIWYPADHTDSIVRAFGADESSSLPLI